MTTTYEQLPLLAVDQEHADLCQSAGDYLAGLIAAGLLNTAARPDKLPELLWPDADPELVRTIWQAGLTTGMWAGKASTRPEWARADLVHARDVLQNAGYQGMARLTHRAARLHPAPAAHPADPEQTHTREGRP